MFDNNKLFKLDETTRSHMISKIYESDRSASVKTLIISHKNEFYVVGNYIKYSSNCPSSICNCLLIVKSDELGNLEWFKIYLSELSTYVKKAYVRKDNTILITGDVYYLKTLNNLTYWDLDIFVLIINQEGNVVSYTTVGGEYNEAVHDIVPLKKDISLLVGSKSNSANTYCSEQGGLCKNLFFAEIGDYGKLIHEQLFERKIFAEGTGLFRVLGGYIIVAEKIGYESLGNVLWVIKIDDEYKPVWDVNYKCNNTETDSYKYIDYITNGNDIIVFAQCFGIESNNKLLMIKFDKSGSIVGETEIQLEFATQEVNDVELIDNDVYIAGKAKDAKTTKHQSFISKLTKDGDIEWSKYAQSNFSNEGIKIANIHNRILLLGNINKPTNDKYRTSCGGYQCTDIYITDIDDSNNIVIGLEGKALLR